MIRLLGAITGSALALAALLVLIGIPQFRTESPDVDRAVVTLPYSTQPVDDAPSSAASEAATAGDDADASPVEALESSAQRAAEIPAGDPVPPSFAEPLQDWHAFWSPFRSELAASGFIEQLQQVTGLDYRVIKVKTGVYEVAFAYEDDAEISSYLSQITAATGLNMSEQ